MAPSGENCQPWRFTVSEHTICVYNVTEADQSVYNTGQLGSYVAHGALIENMCISARQHGYEPQVTLFPLQADEPDLVATIVFTPTKATEDPLYAAIAQRVTNRKQHISKKIPIDIKNELTAAVKTGGTTLVILDDETVLRELGTALAVNEEVLFENRALHDFFYAHLLWNKDEQLNHGGFYWETLEFLPKQIPAVKLFKSWLLLKTMNTVAHVSKKIAKENADKYASSSALAAIIADGHSPTDYMYAGQTAERVWLTATQHGLAVHPCTGTLFFMEHVRSAGTHAFSAAHQELIRNAYTAIAKAFGAQNKTIPMLFRIGYANPPSARSLRMAPVILTE